MRAHILLADNDLISMQVAASCLANAGYQVEHETDDATSLAAVHARPIDLLVTMIPRPDPVGDHDFVAKIRDRHPTLPILFLSQDLNGLTNSDQIGRPSAFLHNPFDPPELLVTVEALLNDPLSLTHNRVLSNDRHAQDRPTGTPTDDRHAMETAYCWEDEKQPGSLNDQAEDRHDIIRAAPSNPMSSPRR